MRLEEELMRDKLYQLTVNVVSDANAINRETQQYMLSATDELARKTIADPVVMWTSPLYDEVEYRRAMSGSCLTEAQIDSPILTRTQTTFGGRGGGELMFSEDDIKKMGLEAVR